MAALLATWTVYEMAPGTGFHVKSTGSVGKISVWLSAGEIGTGALLFARHPALHSTGVAMVISMVTGYLSSVIVIPALCSLLGSGRKEPADI